MHKMKCLALMKVLGVLVSLSFTSGALAQEKNKNPLQVLTGSRAWLNTSRALDNDDLKGRIILLDFWTYCCINCIHVMPDLKELEDEFKEKLTVIGVHSAKFTNEKDADNIRNAILRYGLGHPVVNDASFSIWNAFHVQAWPTFVLIDPEGKIILSVGGEGQKAILRKAISELVAKYEGQLKLNTSRLPLSLERDKAAVTELQFPGKIIYVSDFEGKPVLFISDSSNDRILIVNLQGEITDVIGQKSRAGRADGSFGEALFNKPQGLAFASQQLFVADTGNHTLRLVDFKSKKVTTIAGTGRQGDAKRVSKVNALTTALNSPWDVAFSADQKELFVAMAGDHQIWSYDVSTKKMTTVAGNGAENIRDGIYPDNSLAQTSGLGILKKILYFVDAETSSLRELEDKRVTTLIGSGLFDFGPEDGKLGVGRLQHPLGIAVTEAGVFIADAYNQAIRQYDFKTRELKTIAGGRGHGRLDGAFKNAQFNEPNGIVFVRGRLGVGDVAYVTDTNNGLIRVLDFTTGMVTTLNVHEKNKIFVPELAAELPNLTVHPPVTVTARSGVKVKIKIDKTWHINELAPSQISFFDVSAKIPSFVQSFDRAAISGLEMELPALVAGKTYRIQGVFYYCEVKLGSACLVQSHDQVIKVRRASVGPDAKSENIIFRLRTEIKK